MGPGHPGKIPGTSQIPLFETQGRQTFEEEPPHQAVSAPKKLIFVLFFLA